MVELTGELAEETQLVLTELKFGIKAGQRTVTETHDFELKLAGIEMMVMHIEFNYMEHEDLNEFFMEISDELIELRDELEALKKGEIHVILKEEAAKKIGKSWILKHRKKIEDEIQEEVDIDEKILNKMHQTFKSLKEKFSQVEHMFSVDIEKATVTNVKLELEENEEEIKHILEKLMEFFITYEQIFKKEIDSLNQ